MEEIVQDTLFDLDDKDDSLSKLDVVRVCFQDSESLNWRDLFEGFDDIKAITYSSGLSFMYDLLEMFDTCEVGDGFFINIKHCPGGDFCFCDFVALANSEFLG